MSSSSACAHAAARGVIWTARRNLLGAL
jgi:hypothetical protein